MARASKQSLEKLEAMLAQIRAIEPLTESKPGIFYLKREPMLHFHEQDGVAYAHMKTSEGGFDDFAVNTVAERNALVRELRHRCAARLGAVVKLKSK
jgi:hypothetical protein